MRMSASWVIAVLLGVPAVAAADESKAAPPAAARIERDAKAYCEWVHAAATSEAAPLVAPALFVSGGVVNGAEASVGVSALPPTARLTAGASYSVSSLFRGLAVSDRADADCALY